MNRATLAAWGSVGLELLEEFADWGAVVGETPPPQQVADWLARNDLPTLPPGSGAAPPAAGMSEDRLAAVEATVGRLMDLLETSLTRALQVPRIASALEEVELDLSSLTLTVIPSHNTAVEDSPWDAAAAVAAMPNEAAVLRYCHASYDADGDPDAKGTYHFPHHRTQGGPANLGACRNGKARVGPSGVPDADKPGIERHLQNHLDAQPSNEGWAPDHVQDFLAGIRL
jgi:hypothetical protein